MTITVVPKVEVELGGEPLRSSLDMRTCRVRVVQIASLPTQFEVTILADPEHETFDRAIGQPLRLWADGRSLATGLVSAVTSEASQGRCTSVRLRGYDRMYGLRFSQQQRSFQDRSSVEVTGEVVSSRGLEVVDHGVPSGSRPIIHQSRCSDLALLTRLLTRDGGAFHLSDSRLDLYALDGTGETVEVDASNQLLEGRIDDRGEVDLETVVALGWDPTHFEPAASSPGPASESGSVHTVPGHVLDGHGHAERIANTERSRRLAARLTFEGTVDGATDLRPGVHLHLRNWPGRTVPPLLIVEAEHTIDAISGYVTRLSTVPRHSPLHEQVPVVHRGVVASIDDPDERARVRVRIPAIGDLLTDWMPVVTPGAGPGHGLLAIPAVDTDVLVVLPDKDEAQGVVLGGVFKRSGTPREDGGVRGSDVAGFSFVTPDGQSVELDDRNDSIRVKDSRGSLLELGQKAVRISSAVDLVLEAPKKKIVIRGQKVLFERG